MKLELQPHLDAAVTAAHAFEQARIDRARAFRDANENGVCMIDIGNAEGLSESGVYRIIQGYVSGK